MTLWQARILAPEENKSAHRQSTSLHVNAAELFGLLAPGFQRPEAG